MNKTVSKNSSPEKKHTTLNNEKYCLRKRKPILDVTIISHMGHVRVSFKCKLYFADPKTKYYTTYRTYTVHCAIIHSH